MLPPSCRVLLLGGTGSIGRATARALVGAGHEVVCLVRPRSGAGAGTALERARQALSPAQVRAGLGHLDPYFSKLADGMVAWIESWRKLNPEA